MLNQKAIQKYLSTYSEPETQHAASCINRAINTAYEYVLVIPAFKESHDFLTRLPNNAERKYLLILVINQPENTAVNPLNKILFSFIKNNYSQAAQNNNCYLFTNKTCDVLVVDRFTEPHQIPEKQGVGLARKIGADIACQLIQQNKIKHPWIFSSDADAYLPNDYFSVITQLEENTCAIHYAFKHVRNGKDECSANQKIYEQYMDQYYQGLLEAGSHYAYPSLGSCIAFTYEAYAQVRGFPKRAAGEDFYLLNKLRKIGKVQVLTEPLILIEERLSDRVPFGTGPALEKINQLKNPETDFTFYKQSSFTYLKCVLEISEQLNLSSENKAHQLVDSYAEKYELNAGIIHHVLDDLAFPANFEKLKHNSCSDEQLQYQLFCWFDAFKTLKFIHIVEKLTTD